MSESAYLKLSRQMREARKAADLSQDDLAALAETSRRPIYMLESGKGSIRVETLIQILDALGLEIEVRPKRPLR
jgi:HTH-type transcriptional regulator / antitoxin HipB